jgi:hypothetical protein
VPSQPLSYRCIITGLKILFFVAYNLGKVQGGGAAVQRAFGPVQGSRLLLTSDIILQTSYIFFEHPPSPSTLKGLHLSLVFSLLRRKKTAPPVALTLR